MNLFESAYFIVCWSQGSLGYVCLCMWPRLEKCTRGKGGWKLCCEIYDTGLISLHKQRTTHRPVPLLILWGDRSEVSHVPLWSFNWWGELRWNRIKQFPSQIHLVTSQSTLVIFQSDHGTRRPSANQSMVTNSHLMWVSSQFATPSTHTQRFRAFLRMHACDLVKYTTVACFCAISHVHMCMCMKSLRN